MTMTIRHFRGPCVLSENARAFDDLAQRLNLPITARRRWLEAWVETYRHWEPWLIVVQDGENLMAAAPLARRRFGPLLEVVMLGDGPSDDARLPIADLKFAAPLAHGVSSGLPARQPWRLRLRQLPLKDPVITALSRLLPVSRVLDGQAMPMVEVSGSDPRAYLSRNARKALAKAQNRLRTRGLEPQIRWTVNQQEIIDLLPELMRVHRERDLSLGRRPDHDDPAAAEFYREAIKRLATAGEIELLTLRLQGELAAYVCGFRDGRILRSWDNRMAPRWGDVSAGRLANTEALVHVVTSPDYDALDWMRGEEPYKLQSATRVIHVAQLHAWSSHGLQRTDEVAQKMAGLARAALHRWPVAEQAVRRAQRMTRRR